jgi:UDPglucose 6-dehydrogenase
LTVAVVGFAGMTHLGLVSATGLASRGLTTICYDGDVGLVDRLRRGDLPVVEPGLDDMLQRNGTRQSFTAALRELSACDVVYVAPDVPTDDQGNSDTSRLSALIAQVSGVLKPTAILVILSQVPPGFTRAIASPPPERRYYQVETLVFGRAVERATEPERYIIGCADTSRPIDPQLAAVLGVFNCPILPMRYESAELAKISINFCLVSSISVANTLSEVCEAVGAVWSEIVPALKLDRRIGAYSYLAPGLGIAGGNLERDLTTIETIAEKCGADATVVRAWKSNSRHRRDWAVRTIRRALLDSTPNAVVAVWGLAYKENTHSTKNSPSLATLAQLPDTRFRLHDPVVPISAARHGRAVAGTSPLDAAKGADALMILTPWPEYRKIPVRDIAATLKTPLVLDPYGVLDAAEAEKAGIIYHTLGRPVPGQPGEALL